MASPQDAENGMSGSDHAGLSARRSQWARRSVKGPAPLTQRGAGARRPAGRRPRVRRRARRTAPTGARRRIPRADAGSRSLAAGRSASSRACQPPPTSQPYHQGSEVIRRSGGASPWPSVGAVPRALSAQATTGPARPGRSSPCLSANRPRRPRPRRRGRRRARRSRLRAPPSRGCAAGGRRGRRPRRGSTATTNVLAMAFGEPALEQGVHHRLRRGGHARTSRRSARPSAWSRCSRRR